MAQTSPEKTPTTRLSVPLPKPLHAKLKALSDLTFVPIGELAADAAAEGFEAIKTRYAADLEKRARQIRNQDKKGPAGAPPG